MEFALQYEIQRSRPHYDGFMYDIYHQATEQVKLADRLGFPQRRRFTFDRKIFRKDPRRCRTKRREKLVLRTDARKSRYPILWRTSDEASYVTGSVLMVDGGQLAK